MTSSTPLQAEHDHLHDSHKLFKSLSNQLVAAKLGMWIFIASEILMFGGLFWHTVNLVWLFLFPLLYLTEHH